MITRGWLLVAVICAIALLGCQDEKADPPADYASFYQMGSRQWVTKVNGIKPDAIPQIREVVEQVEGVTKGSVIVGTDYVAFHSEAEPGDRLEHSRVGSDVSAILKKQKDLRVGDSTTGPQ